MIPIVVETERLILRQFHVADFDDLAELLMDAEVMEFSTSGALSSREVAEKLETFRGHWPKWGFGQTAVVHKEDRKVIGYCGLVQFDDIDGRTEIEIGYRLNRNYWGQGFATEAARAIRDFGFNVLSLKRMISIIDPMNHRSIRVAEKNGLHHEKDAVVFGFDERIYVIER